MRASVPSGHLLDTSGPRRRVPDVTPRRLLVTCFVLGPTIALLAVLAFGESSPDAVRTTVGAQSPAETRLLDDAGATLVDPKDGSTTNPGNPAGAGSGANTGAASGTGTGSGSGSGSSTGSGPSGPSGAPSGTGPSVGTPSGSTSTGPGSDDDPATTATTAPAPQLLQIRVVPAVADLRMVIDGRTYASGADGRVRAVVDGDTASVRVLDYTITPPLQQVSLLRWADGTVGAERTLPATGSQREIDLGVEVRYRITVNAPGADQVALQRGDTTTTVAAGEATWIPAQRAVSDGAGGFSAVPLSYVATPLDANGDTTGQGDGQRLVLSPEAVFELDPVTDPPPDPTPPADPSPPADPTAPAD